MALGIKNKVIKPVALASALAMLPCSTNTASATTKVPFGLLDSDAKKDRQDETRSTRSKMEAFRRMAQEAMRDKFEKKYPGAEIQKEEIVSGYSTDELSMFCIYKFQYKKNGQVFNSRLFYVINQDHSKQYRKIFDGITLTPDDYQVISQQPQKIDMFIEKVFRETLARGGYVFVDIQKCAPDDSDNKLFKYQGVKQDKITGEYKLTNGFCLFGGFGDDEKNNPVMFFTNWKEETTQSTLKTSAIDIKLRRRIRDIAQQYKDATHYATVFLRSDVQSTYNLKDALFQHMVRFFSAIESEELGRAISGDIVYGGYGTFLGEGKFFNKNKKTIETVYCHFYLTGREWKMAVYPVGEELLGKNKLEVQREDAYAKMYPKSILNKWQKEIGLKEIDLKNWQTVKSLQYPVTDFRHSKPPIAEMFGLLSSDIRTESKMMPAVVEKILKETDDYLQGELKNRITREIAQRIGVDENSVQIIKFDFKNRPEMTEMNIPSNVYDGEMVFQVKSSKGEVFVVTCRALAVIIPPRLNSTGKEIQFRVKTSFDFESKLAFEKINTESIQAVLNGMRLGKISLDAELKNRLLKNWFVTLKSDVIKHQEIINLLKSQPQEELIIRFIREMIIDDGFVNSVMKIMSQFEGKNEMKWNIDSSYVSIGNIINNKHQAVLSLGIFNNGKLMQKLPIEIKFALLSGAKSVDENTIVVPIGFVANLPTGKQISGKTYIAITK